MSQGEGITHMSEGEYPRNNMLQWQRSSGELEAWEAKVQRSLGE